MAAAQGTHQSICVMIGDVSYDFSAELMKGFFNAAGRHSVRLLLMMGMPRHAGHFELESVEKGTYHYNSIYDFAGITGADAYVFSCGALSGFEGENIYQKFLTRFGDTPYVILQEKMDVVSPRSSGITIDNYSSFTQCIEHLLKVHHLHKIGFVGGLKKHPDTRERLRAYRDTMERYGQPVEETMIAYGDFSEYSDKCVAWLLDQNPGLEAIAFCNDEMAKGGYRECARRGLKIGVDIAITGFDNFSTSRALIPPLTTISQNTYSMGEMAIEHAVALLQGESVACQRLQTKLHIRRSCGCHPRTVEKLFACEQLGGNPDLQAVTRNMAIDLMNAYPQSERKSSQPLVHQLTEHIWHLCQNNPDTMLDREAYAQWLQSFCQEHTNSIIILAKRLNDYVMQMPEVCFSCGDMRKLYDILSFTHGFFYSFKAQISEQNLDDFRAQSWFIPELIRDLVGYESNDETVFLNVVERLDNLHLRNMYICLLSEPRPLMDSKNLHIPGVLRLAAYKTDSKAMAYPYSQMPVIDTENALIDLPELRRDTNMMCFSIFSGGMQYGVFLCEVDIPKSHLVHIIGLQLGILINYLDLKHKEKIVGNELENIRERNEILNFLSEYDSQCTILNRRGFIERAIRLNRENVGKHAVCVFMDLDHLKEINDTFGHSQGDVALVAMSDMLKQTVRSNDLVARIGGDEFVGMFVVEAPEYAATFKTRLQNAFAHYNQSSGLPFFVEASIGIAHFTCNLGMEISKIVNDADHYLYEAKKQKRRSALKPQP